MGRGLHGLNLPWAPKEGAPWLFFISFSRCGTEEEEGRMRLKSCPHSNIKKLESDSLLKYFIDEDP